MTPASTTAARPRRRPLLPLLALAALACSCDDCGAPKGAARPRSHAARLGRAPATAGFVAIAPGRFSMGSPATEESRYTNEERHEVTLTHAFELAATEVTQAGFAEVMGYDPSRFKGCARCPVENVSWHEAAAYCNRLSDRRRLERCYRCSGAGPAVTCDVAAAHRGAGIYRCPGYRLPTDAEWEYAYRAGRSTPYFNGTNDPRLRASCAEADPVAGAIGWYCQNSAQRTHEVGQKQQNPWGLFDMAGNVWEWCHDKYLAILSGAATDPWGIDESPMRVARGGSWRYYARGMRAACRAWYKPHYRGDAHGLRPARTL